MLSLHATKVFGVGEGGLVLCRNAELIQRCGQVMNFGFLGSREAQVAGFNGKLSEYHAAIGLAALDPWPGCGGFLATAAAYRRAVKRRGRPTRSSPKPNGRRTMCSIGRRRRRPRPRQ